MLKFFFKAKSLPVGHVTTLKGGKKIQKIAPKKWAPVKLGLKVKKKTDTEDLASRIQQQKLGSKLKLHQLGEQAKDVRMKNLKISTITPKQMAMIKKDSKFKNEFIKQNGGFIREQVKGVFSEIGDPDDYFQDGSEGFLTAIDKYNPKYSRGAFVNYAKMWIKRNTGNKAVRKLTEKIDKVTSSLNKQVGGKGGDKAIEVQDLVTSKDTENLDTEVTANAMALMNQLEDPQTKEVFRHMIGLNTQILHHNQIADKMGISVGKVSSIVRNKIYPKAKEFLTKSETFQSLIVYIEEWMNQ